MQVVVSMILCFSLLPPTVWTRTAPAAAAIKYDGELCKCHSSLFIRKFQWGRSGIQMTTGHGTMNTDPRPENML